jgi:hypothetical protein
LSARMAPVARTNDRASLAVNPQTPNSTQSLRL